MKPIATANYDVPLQTFLRTGKIGAARAMLHDFYGGIKDNVGDAIVETKKAVYVFDFKFNRSARAAVRQIREKGYADAYKAGRRPVTLVGINFAAKKRNIDEPLIVAM